MEAQDFLDTLTARSNARGPFASFYQIGKFAGLAATAGLRLKGRRCIDFGCALIRPLSVASLLYLLGAREVMAIELEPEIQEAPTAVGLYALVVAVLSGKLDVPLADLGTTWEEVRARAATFDLAALLRGHLSGVPPVLRFVSADYLTLAPEEQRFDLMISNSVWEHVDDLPRILAAFRHAISADGAIYTAIDYRDHRLYTIGASRWQYLMDDSDHAPRYINKVRHSEMISMIEQAGFDVAEEVTVREEPSVDEQSKFLPRYQHLPPEDIAITEAHLLLRPK